MEPCYPGRSLDPESNYTIFLRGLVGVLVPVTLVGLVYTHNGLLPGFLVTVDVTHISALSSTNRRCSHAVRWLLDHLVHRTRPPDTPKTSDASDSGESTSEEDHREVRYRRRVISRVVDFIDEQMSLDSDGKLRKISQEERDTSDYNLEILKVSESNNITLTRDQINNKIIDEKSCHHLQEIKHNLATKIKVPNGCLDSQNIIYTFINDALDNKQFSSDAIINKSSPSEIIPTDPPKNVTNPEELPGELGHLFPSPVQLESSLTEPDLIPTKKTKKMFSKSDPSRKVVQESRTSTENRVCKLEVSTIEVDTTQVVQDEPTIGEAKRPTNFNSGKKSSLVKRQTEYWEKSLHKNCQDLPKPVRPTKKRSNNYEININCPQTLNIFVYSEHGKDIEKIKEISEDEYNFSGIVLRNKLMFENRLQNGDQNQIKPIPDRKHQPPTKKVLPSPETSPVTSPSSQGTPTPPTSPQSPKEVRIVSDETKQRIARYRQAKTFFQTLEESTSPSEERAESVPVSRSRSEPCLTWGSSHSVDFPAGGSLRTRKLSERFHVNNLFQDIVGDFQEGFFGMPNKMAVVASLASFEKPAAINNGNDQELSPMRATRRKDTVLQNFSEEYPHVPSTDLAQYRPRSYVHHWKLIPRKMLIAKSTQEFYV